MLQRAGLCFCKELVPRCGQRRVVAVEPDPLATHIHVIVRAHIDVAVPSGKRNVLGVDLGGASDHAGFAEAGIVVGGIFSGATELKTDTQATTFGGEAGQPMDPCYHLTCDTVANVDVEQVVTFGKAAAGAALAVARGELLP